MESDKDAWQKPALKVYTAARSQPRPMIHMTEMQPLARAETMPAESLIQWELKFEPFSHAGGRPNVNPAKPERLMIQSFECVGHSLS